MSEVLLCAYFIGRNDIWSRAVVGHVALVWFAHALKFSGIEHDICPVLEVCQLKVQCSRNVGKSMELFAQQNVGVSRFGRLANWGDSTCVYTAKCSCFVEEKRVLFSNGFPWSAVGGVHWCTFVDYVITKYTISCSV